LVLLNPKVLQRKGMGKRISKSRGLNSQPRLKLKRKSTGSQPRTLEANANQPHPEALTDQSSCIQFYF